MLVLFVPGGPRVAHQNRRQEIRVTFCGPGGSDAGVERSLEHI